jgi:hypothetical protein
MLRFKLNFFNLYEYYLYLLKNLLFNTFLLFLGLSKITVLSGLIIASTSLLLLLDIVFADKEESSPNTSNKA